MHHHVMHHHVMHHHVLHRSLEVGYVSESDDETQISNSGVQKMSCDSSMKLHTDHFTKSRPVLPDATEHVLVSV